MPTSAASAALHAAKVSPARAVSLGLDNPLSHGQTGALGMKLSIHPSVCVKLGHASWLACHSKRRPSSHNLLDSLPLPKSRVTPQSIARGSSSVVDGRLVDVEAGGKRRDRPKSFLRSRSPGDASSVFVDKSVSPMRTPPALPGDTYYHHCAAHSHVVGAFDPLLVARGVRRGKA